MIIDLPDTTASAINRSLVDLREQGGTLASGRVLTLVIVTDDASAEGPIAAANRASFEHPCRVIVLGRSERRGSPRMDAQIRVGGDAGASETIVLRLYGELVDHGADVVVPLLLPDAPVVAWWPTECPGVPAADSIGRLAQRRITDMGHAEDTAACLERLQRGYRPGDTDLTWTRLTTWRGLLAAALDQPPTEEVTSATAAGAADSVSTDLLAGWLALQLDCPVTRVVRGEPGTGMHEVVMNRLSGPVTLARPGNSTGTLHTPNQPDRHVALARRSLAECMAEELRRLDADEVYADVLQAGIGRFARGGTGPVASDEARARDVAPDETTRAEHQTTNGGIR